MEDVFGKGTAEGTRPLLPPGNCWICDNSPQQEEMKVIDTRRNTQAGGTMSHLSNRKYICEPCALQMGGAMGMVPLDTHIREMDISAELAEEVDALKQRLAEAVVAQTRVISAEEVERMLQAVVKPPARRTPAAQK